MILLAAGGELLLLTHALFYESWIPDAEGNCAEVTIAVGSGFLTAIFVLGAFFVRDKQHVADMQADHESPPSSP